MVKHGFTLITILSFCTISLAQTGKVGVNTISPAAVFHVLDSSILFSSTLTTLPVTPGSPPLSGSGIRTFWYSDKAAFRTGRVTGTQWDKNNIGNYSFAAGQSNTASGLQSFGMGKDNIASGENTTAIGSANKANALNASAFGIFNVANGTSSFVIGRFNDSIQALNNNITATTPLFIVGNGNNTTSRKNALTVLFNGNVGVGTTSIPEYRLHVTNNNNADGGWAEGIMIENTSTLANVGEAGLSFDNASIPENRRWTEGLDQNPSLAWNYGSAFSAANTKMVLDTMGRLGVGTTSPVARLHVQDSSVLFAGPTVLPSPAAKPPVSGPGTRMHWYVDKAAFRAGTVTGTQWDKDSTGVNSFSAGLNTVAKGAKSVAMGEDARATGPYAVALGREVNAIGSSSSCIGAFSSATGGNSVAIGSYAEATDIFAVSIGYQTVASNDNSVAIGNSAIASGNSAVALGLNQAKGANSTAIGLRSTAIGTISFASGDSTRATADNSFSAGTSTIARSFSSVAIGRYNDTTSTFLTTWAGTDPVFVIGNGSSNTNRQNAMTVLKNGKTGLGTISPHNILVIRGADDANDGPVLGLGGSTSDQEESGRIRFYEGTTSTNMRGSYIHLDAALNRFHIGIHPTTDNIVTNDEPVITIDRATGDLGIGTQTPAYDLEVNGSAAKPGGGSWTNASDARLKQNIEPYTDGLKTLLQINPVRYRYNTKSGFDTSKTYIGVIAQELNVAAPYMVNTSERVLEDGSTGYYDVDNSAMTYMLINAVKEQQTIIDHQQERIDALEMEMAEIRALLKEVSKK